MGRLLAPLVATLALLALAGPAIAAAPPALTPPALAPPALTPPALAPPALTPPALAPLRAAVRGAGDPIVGVGEQDAGVFDDMRLRQLGIQDVRYVVPWDALRGPRWERDELDGYMAQAEAVGAHVLVAFNVSRVESRRSIIPTPAQYRAMFLSFRKRYPFVREFITWNEANHHSQPTARRPALAAAYYAVLRRACPSCTIVAADVLDDATMVPWVKAFQQAATVRPRIWGIHNYLDANHFRSTGTRALLEATHGDIWFTETGGIVWRRTTPKSVPLAQGVHHAADATRWVFRLARLSPRIKRVYLYHWSFPKVLDRWDSALVAKNGQSRPALQVVRAHMRASAVRAAAQRRAAAAR